MNPMNLLINDVCNRSCSYCFAQNRVKLGQDVALASNNIRLEAVRVYLAFLKRSHISEFKILGGEPTLHPQFSEIVDLGLMDGFTVVVFTNGMWNRRVCEYVASLGSASVKMVVNVNEPRYWKGKEGEYQARCLEAAGAKAMIGFNIFEPDFDLLFTRELIARFGLQRELRLGLASPILGQANQFISVSMREQIGSRLLDQLEQLEASDVLGCFDCGFVYCMFPEERWGTLIRSVQNGFLSLCRPIIDVGPDLSAWPCFPLSQLLTVDLRKYENRTELVRYFSERLSAFRQFGTRDECRECAFFRRQQCTGGCIAHCIRGFADSDPAVLHKAAS